MPQDRNISRPKMLAAGLVLATAGGMLLVAWGDASGGSKLRPYFVEAFDDQALGAVPEGLADPGDPVIQPSVGALLGYATAPEAEVAVEASVGAVDLGRVLRLSDANVPEGAGHCGVECYPSVPAGPGSVTVSFVFRSGKPYGDSFFASVIDNRATPGAGVLARIRVRATGELVLDDQPTGILLFPNEAYVLVANLDLDPAGPDQWMIRVQNLSDPGTIVTYGPLPCEADGEAVTTVEFRTDDVGTGTFDIDDVLIEVD